MIDLNKFNEEYEEFEDSTLYLSEEDDRDARLKFKKKILDMVDKYPDNPDLYHKLGLCLYNMSTWEREDKTDIEIAFHRALLLDKYSIFSRIFLVHFYFDIGAFYLSLKLNSTVDFYSQNSRVPIWRLVKLHEIKLCCMIYLEVLESNELNKELINIINEYEKLDEDDLIAAEPSELLKVLERYLNTYDSDSIKGSLDTLQRMNKGD